MLIFIIPVYNEAKNISRLLDDIKELNKNNLDKIKLIIVDDGSRDQTDEIIKEYQKKMPIELYTHQVNLGPGNAFMTGFEAALKILKPEDIVVTLEADNTADLKLTKEMIKKIKNGFDLVLASCYAPQGKVIGTSLYRKILSSGVNLLIKLIFPLKGINTFSSFYRAYSGEVILKAYQIYQDRLIEEEGFTCMTELLIKLNKLGIRITEIPMTFQGNFRQGKSKMKIGRTILAYLDLILKEKFRKKA